MAVPAAPRFPEFRRALLDSGPPGSFRSGPSNTYVPQRRRYVPGTMVLGTTWQTPTGWMTVHDLLVTGPVQAEARRAAEITPIEDHHPAHDQLSALLAESGQTRFRE